MILHSVYLALRADADPAELADVMQSLAALVGQIDGFAGFAHGPNRDLEGKSPDAPYGFVCTFDDVTALAAYAADPRHTALGTRLVDLCGGADGIMVYDLDVGA